MAEKEEGWVNVATVFWAIFYYMFGSKRSEFRCRLEQFCQAGHAPTEQVWYDFPPFFRRYRVPICASEHIICRPSSPVPNPRDDTGKRNHEKAMSVLYVTSWPEDVTHNTARGRRAEPALSSWLENVTVQSSVTKV